jgi:hypothetical protein
MKTKQELIKSNWDISKCFEQLRFDKNHHLGLGDIRLTIEQQDEICKLVNSNLYKSDAIAFTNWILRNKYYFSYIDKKYYQFGSRFTLFTPEELYQQFLNREEKQK